MKARKGFTLVEILIVVVILGILAAIVIPQFTDASTQAQLASLSTDLQTVRSQIELYKIQHNDTPPAFLTFEAQMTQYSDKNGATQATKDGVYCYGPYLQKIPTNQFTNSAALTNDGIVTAGSGWDYVVTATGSSAFHADDTAEHFAL